MVSCLILFAVYEQNFIRLELFTQVLLSIGISFPITSFSTYILTMNKTLDETKSNLYQIIGEIATTSFSYSAVFSIFYIAKHLINYDTNLYPVIALLVIIILNLVFFLKNKDVVLLNLKMLLIKINSSFLSIFSMPRTQRSEIQVV